MSYSLGNSNFFKDNILKLQLYFKMCIQNGMVMVNE